MSNNTVLFDKRSGTKQAPHIIAQEREEKLANKRRQQGPWLHAWHDPVANVRAFSNCVRLVDLKGDGEYSLVIADWKRRLRVYTNTNLVNNSLLLGVPTALEVFYPYADSNVPSIAVGAGSFIYIYRNLHPYYKFSLPNIKVSDEEKAIWNDICTNNKILNDSDELDNIVKELENLRYSNIKLSYHSIKLLSLSTESEQIKYINEFKNKNDDSNIIEQHTVVTCLSSVKKTMEDDPYGVSQLIIGTEHGEVLILNTAGSAVLKRIQLPSIPSIIQSTGVYDNDYRLIISCRNGCIYTIKKGKLLGNKIQLPTPCSSLCIANKSIIVSCMDKTIHSYRFKGQHEYTISLKNIATIVSSINIQRSGQDVVVIAAALINGDILLYNKKYLVHTLQTGEPIRALCMGPFGREDVALVMCFKSGGLQIKLMGRKVDLSASTKSNTGPAEEQNTAIEWHKSHLFGEQLKREQSHGVDMHRVFQRDLCKLRLTTTRSYAQLITRRIGSVTKLKGNNINMDVNIYGLGPYFDLKLSLKNTSLNTLINIPIIIKYDQQLYHISPPTFVVPILLPSILYEYHISIESLDIDGLSDNCYIYICSPNSSVPLLTGAVTMPVSEALLED